MRGAFAAAALLVMLTLPGGRAFADEESIHLRDGGGRDVTAGHCGICHSLDYIPANAPVMDRTGWQKS
ncbi:MAG TPA: hypothetical protein VEH00_04235, partial [Steroidobacteraceae bacterium]|nr:hypothetical protein [Steroidobacteraceae bacterium]